MHSESMTKQEKVAGWEWADGCDWTVLGTAADYLAQTRRRGLSSTTSMLADDLVMMMVEDGREQVWLLHQDTQKVFESF